MPEDNESRPRRPRVQVAVGSGEEFLRNYGRAAANGSIVLALKSQLPAGRDVKLVITLKSGGVILEADAVVEAGPPGKLVLRLTAISAEGKTLLGKLPAQGAPGSPVTASSKPAPPITGVATAVARATESSHTPTPIEDDVDVSDTGSFSLLEDPSAAFGERPAAFQFPPIEGTRSARRIGIDLGTAFTCAGYVENGAVQLIPTDRGRVSFPSAVYVQQDHFLVGELAVQRIESHSSHVVHSWKRLLGRRFDSAAVQDVLAHVGYQVEAGPSGEAAVRIDDQLCHPIWFAARVLYEIRLRTQEHLGEVVEEAVITVPAHYTDPQRADVRAAAKLAGFTAVRLITEPVAAAIAYGIGRDLEKTLLIYDFGGGTFDVSLLEVEGHVFQVAATGGDPFLGGVDFDDRIMGYLLVEFRKRYGLNLTSDAAAMARVGAASERAKRDLSEKSTARVQLPFLARVDGQGVAMDLEITREHFESISGDLIARSLAACDETLRHAGLKADDIDEVVPVGGMSRMPLIQNRVKEHFGKPLRRGVNADEAVARGAALFADALGKEGSMAILDVVSLAVGVQGPDGESFIPVIPTRASLPATKTHVVTADRDGQTEFRVDVYQGNGASIAYCEYLGTTVSSGLPPARRGETLAEITFSMNEEGSIALAMRPRNGPTKRLSLNVSAGRARPAKLPGDANERGYAFLRKLLGGR